MIKISKQEVLLITQGGILFYKMVISELEVIGTKCKNVHNPFYEDKNPSLSIYLEDGIWKFKDHGNPEFSGDVFQFAALYLGLDVEKDFPRILEDLLDFDYTEEALALEQSKSKTKKVSKSKTYDLVRRKDDKFNLKERKYFDQYGITTQILNEYGVVPLEGYEATNSAGESYEEWANHKKLMFAYLFNNGAKIYKPLDQKGHKFTYVGAKPSDYVFGLSQAEDTAHNFIILTGGEKDVLTLAGLGYQAICLSSERAKLPPTLQKELYFENQLTILSLYDFDKTGREETEKLLDEHGINKIIIPKKYRLEGKDISDFVKAGMTKKQFDKCINLTLSKIKKTERELAEVKDSEEEQNSSTIEISYNLLPSLFARCVEPFEVEQERRLILLSSLVVVGSLLHRVRGFYRDNAESANLFLFISAPAASGKSKMKFARGLGWGVHKHLMKMTEGAEEMMTLYIPADSSSAAFVKALNSNNGNACLFEPEADRLSESIEKDWSDYSTVMRCAYHQEPISYLRKTNNERIAIENPFLAILLSGTPLQVTRLFGNTENGLFSRFAFFSFYQEPFWDRNLHKRSHGLDLNNYFKEMGDELLEMYLSLDRFENDVLFELSEKQWDVFHDYYESIHDKYIEVFGVTAGSSIKRLGLMTYKIAMILSASRYLNAQIPNEIICKDDDFQISLELSEILIDNFMNIYLEMNKANIRSLFPNNLLYNFYMALPKQFNRAKYLKVASQLGINHKSAETYITQKFVKMKVLEKEGYNLYVKTI